jgi:hypothetical protein
MLGRVREFLEFCDQKAIPRVLAFYIHPWEFWPMEKTYHFGEATVIPDEFITRDCGDKALNALDTLICGLGDMHAEFLTAGMLANIFS